MLKLLRLLAHRHQGETISRSNALSHLRRENLHQQAHKILQCRGNGMKGLVGENYPWPMPRSSDEAMNKMVLEQTQRAIHPCGMNRLSKDVEQGVGGSHLRVHGIKGLRNIDASLFLVIADCRIQNVMYTIGEKCADLIKGDHPEITHETADSVISLPAMSWKA